MQAKGRVVGRARWRWPRAPSGSSSPPPGGCRQGRSRRQSGRRCHIFILYADATGSVPDGRTDYVLHFEAGSLPPADIFWSVTMYDAEGFPVPNEIGRYAIGDRDELRFNKDASLGLYLQHGNPDDDCTANWLPAP